jgi:cell division protein FtsW (lipid II flippase)
VEFFGQGFAKGSQTKYRFLPEPQTDFIFSAIAEEFGFLGVTFFTLFLFFVFNLASSRNCFFSSKQFCSTFCRGL